MTTVQPRPEGVASTGHAALKVTSTDDPRVLADQANDDYSNHVVPLSARVGKWQLAMSFWSLLSAMVWLFYGGLVAALYGSRNAIIALVVSAALYSVWNYFFSRWSIRTGLNSMLLSRRMFGVVGAALTALLVAVNVTYYAVFESSTLAVGFQHYTPHMSIKWWYLIVVVAMLPLMLGGVQNWMAKFNSFLLPFYVVGVVAAIVATAIKFHPGTAWLHFDGVVPPVARVAPGWLLGVSIYFGLFLMMPVSSDFARFGRKEDEKFHQLVSFGPVFYTWLYVVNGIVGIFLVQATRQDPTAETGVVQGILASLGVVGLIFIVISQARINSLNYYESSSSWDRFISTVSPLRIPRAVYVVLVSAAVYVLMLTDVFSWLLKAVTWQGDFFAAWVGVMTVHMLLSRDRIETAEFRAGRLPRFTLGLAVWVVSAGFGIWLTQSTYAGAHWGAFGARMTALAPGAVLILSAALYAVVLLALPAKRRTHADVRDEISDLWSNYAACDHCDKSYVAVEMDRVAANSAVTCDACATNTRVLGIA